MTLLLDTPVLVAVLRGTPPVVDRLRAVRDVPHTSAVAAEALLAAARPDELAAVESLLTWLRITSVGLAEARTAARWRSAFPSLDADTALTAACAALRGATFVRLAPLDLPDLRVAVWAA